MKTERLLELMGEIDEDLILRAEGATYQKKSYVKQKRHPRFRWQAVAAVAACVCLIVGAVLSQFWNRGVTYPDTPPILVGETLSGKTWFDMGDPVGKNKDAVLPIGFYVRTVVEACVDEVLPDIYFDPVSGAEYRIVRLLVRDRIHGAGVPKELYLQYPFYGADVFDGFDTFVFSLSQGFLFDG